MLNGKSLRGRPKGSGIDDTAILLDVARLIEADPRMRPTTAIKAVGVSDPSAIRRLRDKLRLIEAEPRANSAPAACAEAAVTLQAASTAPAKVQSAIACPNESPAARLSQPLERQREQGAVATDAVEPQRRSHGRLAAEAGMEGLLVAWMSFGLAAFNATLQAQQIAAEQLMRLPQISALMRQHVVLNEMAMALYMPKRGGFALH